MTFIFAAITDTRATITASSRAVTVVARVAEGTSTNYNSGNGMLNPVFFEKFADLRVVAHAADGPRMNLTIDSGEYNARNMLAVSAGGVPNLVTFEKFALYNSNNTITVASTDTGVSNFGI